LNTPVRYWLERVYHRRFRRNGVEVVKPNYYVQIQHKGERQRFHLHHPNKAVAAARARDIYKALLTGGWAALTGREENGAWNGPVAASIRTKTTVGELIRLVESVSTVRPTTLRNYVKAFRRIVGDIEGVKRSTKFDATREGHTEWKSRVDSIELHALTPERVFEWKIAFLKTRKSAELRSAKTSVNSLIRNAKALFAKKHIKYLAARMELPNPLPFEGVVMEKQPSMRYQSKIDAAALLRDAELELAPCAPESYKIFLLGLMCQGFRK